MCSPTLSPARILVLHRNSAWVRSFAFARELLRSPKVLQDGAGAEQVDVGNPEHVPVFYLDGDVHKARRKAIVKFFTPQAVKTRHRPIMERVTDELLARVRASGQARLDEVTFELAVSVVSGIVGLTESDRRQMAKRISTLLKVTFTNARGLQKPVKKVREIWHGYQFFVKDVRPAIAERRRQRRDDVISQTLDKGYSEKAIMIECMTYATAGMIATREFIVMASWYLFERPEIRDRFLAGDEEDQLLILQEILRLEPIAAMMYRRADADIEGTSNGDVRAGSHFVIDLRAVNGDEGRWLVSW